MSSLYSRNKDLSSRTRKSVLDSPPSSPSPSTKSFRTSEQTLAQWEQVTIKGSVDHDRISRSDSSGVECPDRLNRTSSYTRRENRLASLNKTDDNSTSRNYKKLYEDALAENEKLKARLEDSKQELTKIRLQLDSVTQEKQALEKRVSDMEEELKASIFLHISEAGVFISLFLNSVLHSLTHSLSFSPTLLPPMGLENGKLSVNSS
ncbi:hypothetical protein P4O66_022244 [Electrophorus voltai]|uniref:cGMP-dependent protein kinase interacting domain-containing protein n=1 Tax=Electrophorus voltai TaxID=2609070 RepID=A0AAD8ZR45_9TELE|nr:hypothetical protein P4O66_022244 [Electrophorus voltai]